MRDNFHRSEYDDEKNNLNLEEEKNGNIDNDLDDEQDQTEDKKEDKEEIKENEKSVSSQGQVSCCEGNKADEEKTSDSEEEGNAEKETETCQIDPGKAQGSYSYVPPQYSSYDEKMKTGEKKDKKKKKGYFNAAMIAFFVALAIIFTTLLPSLIMNIGLLAFNGVVGLGHVIDSAFDGQVDYNDGASGEENKSDTPEGGVSDDMNVIKNDGSININEQIGSTGYMGDLTVAQVVDLVADTVVEITTTNVVTDIFYGQYVTSGAGSGVIITENGYIITNYHVIDGARSVTVRLTDGSEFDADIVGGDQSTDVAVLKINATGLNAAVLGSSRSLVVGQEVVAIGNPLGSLGGTVTDGIISALDRSVVVDGHRMTLMQTNAAINPGNSGGGLFNRAGELIGIVNAKQSNTGIEGLGFAIPIDIAWESVKTICPGANA